MTSRPAVRPATNTPGSRRRRFSGLVATALATAAMVAGSGLAATPARAAAISQVSACFTTAVRINTGPYNRPVHVDYYSNGTWYDSGTTTPYLDGCLTQNVTPGYYWRLRVAYSEGGRWYAGTTQYVLAVAGVKHPLGTLRV